MFKPTTRTSVFTYQIWEARHNRALVRYNAAKAIVTSEALLGDLTPAGELAWSIAKVEFTYALKHLVFIESIEPLESK